MPVDPQAIRAQRHTEIGQIIQRDAELLTDRWTRHALAQQPQANLQHRSTLKDRLPDFLSALGQALAGASTSQRSRHSWLAIEHGEQRWKAGWSLGEVIRDYQILRYIIQDHLAETLQRPLHVSEIIALGLTLDEAVEAAVTMYVQHQESHVRTAEERVLASELVAAEQRERRRLAADLHDYLAQLLVVCKMRVAQAKGLTDPERMPSLLSEMDELLDESLKYTRTLISDLSPDVLYRAGMAAALTWLAERMQEQHGLSVEIRYDGGVPDLPENKAIQVFLTIRELLLNVVKHAQVERAVVTFAQQDDDLIVEVLDQGVGFDAFEAEEAKSERFGLISARERLELMGGRLDIDSAPGRGTRVRLTIPLRLETLDRDEVLRPAEWAPEPPARRIRVLLADDHQMVREGLRFIFDSEPEFEVVGEAANGAEAVEQARTLHPDVIVMDVNMPLMNGIEATRQITSELHTLAVVGLSVDDSEQLARSMREAGAVDFLVKGSPADHLCRAVRAARPMAGSV